MHRLGGYGCVFRAHKEGLYLRLRDQLLTDRIPVLLVLSLNRLGPKEIGYPEFLKG